MRGGLLYLKDFLEILTENQEQLNLLSKKRLSGFYPADLVRILEISENKGQNKDQQNYREHITK